MTGGPFGAAEDKVGKCVRPTDRQRGPSVQRALEGPRAQLSPAQPPRFPYQQTEGQKVPGRQWAKHPSRKSRQKGQRRARGRP